VARGTKRDDAAYQLNTPVNSLFLFLYITCLTNKDVTISKCLLLS